MKVQKRLEILRFQVIWAGTDKIDILVEKNAARRAAYQLRAQRSTRKGHAASVKLHRLAAMSLTAARRVAVGKEEQRRERALTFKKSRSKRYTACSDVVRVTGFEPAAS